MLGKVKVEELELLDSVNWLCWCEPRGSDSMKVWGQVEDFGWIFIAEFWALSSVFIEEFVQGNINTEIQEKNKSEAMHWNYNKLAN